MHKTTRVHIRLTPEDHDALQLEAEHYGVTLSDLIRRRILRQKLIPLVDRQMIGELRRQGGLLKHIYNESGGAYRDKTKIILEDIHDLILQIKTSSP